MRTCANLVLRTKGRHDALRLDAEHVVSAAVVHVAEPSNGNRYGSMCNSCLQNDGMWMQLMSTYVGLLVLHCMLCTNVHHTVPYFTIMRRTIALKSSNSFFRNRWGYNEIVLSAILQALVIANGSGELAQDVKLAVSLEHKTAVA